MIQLLQKFSNQQEDTRTYLSALFYFIDYLLQVPKNLTEQLKNDIIPYMGKEVVQRMQTERTNSSQTLEEIFAELRQEGREEGKKEGRKDALKQFVRKLIRENYADEQIAKLTELDPVQIAKLRKTLKD
ncbi:hypothetical protein [Lentibacillus kapialis]|nr:hypothetical protein [Lentibacillus kapialis]